MKKMKKAASLTLFVLLLYLTTFFAFAWESPFGGSFGDIDSDEAITTTDARFALRFAAELDAPTEEQKTLADVDNDGKITTTDARRILRAAANLSITEPETTEPVSGTTEPVSGTTEPVSGTTEPVSGTTEPVSGTTEPVSGTTEPQTTEPPAEPSEPDPADIVLPTIYFRTSLNDNGFGTESRVMCRVMPDYKETLPVEATPTNKSNPLYSPLLGWTYDYIVGDKVTCTENGETYEYYNLASNRRVYTNDVWVLPAGSYALGPNKATLTEKVVSGKSTDFYIGLDWAVPFNVTLAPQSYVTGYNSRPWNVMNGKLTAEYVDITFYHTQTTEGSLSFPKSNVIDRAVWIEDLNSNTSTLRVYLKKAGAFYGYHAYFDANCYLVFSIKEKPSVDSGLTVALDPGHGGYDGGASAAGVKESSVNLAIAQKVKEKLEQAGVTVILTHNGIASNAVLRLGERTDIIRQKNPDLFISLHCDSSTSASSNGVAVYYYKNYSYALGAGIQSALVEAYNTKLNYSVTDKGVLFYPFYVTRVEECPSVLVEYGYLSNIVTARRITRNTAVCPYSEPSGNLSSGDSGDGVRWVQWHLVQLGYNVGSSGLDGDFGSGTSSAVRSFQTAHGLSADGVVGTSTRAALKSAYSGSSVSSRTNEFSILTSTQGQDALAEGTVAGILKYLAVAD